jgi:hypothetical protein
MKLYICFYTNKHWGYAVVYWFKNYATNLKVAGSRPDEVIFFNLPNPSSRTRPWDSLSL